MHAVLGVPKGGAKRVGFARRGARQRPENPACAGLAGAQIGSNLRLEWRMGRVELGLVVDWREQRRRAHLGLSLLSRPRTRIEAGGPDFALCLAVKFFEAARDAEAHLRVHRFFSDDVH